MAAPAAGEGEAEDDLKGWMLVRDGWGWWSFDRLIVGVGLGLRPRRPPSSSVGSAVSNPADLPTHPLIKLFTPQ